MSASMPHMNEGLENISVNGLYDPSYDLKAFVQYGCPVRAAGGGSQSTAWRVNGRPMEPNVGPRKSGEVEYLMRLEMLAALSMDSVCGANHRIHIRTLIASVSCMFKLTNYQSFLYIPNDRGVRPSAPLDYLPWTPFPSHPRAPRFPFPIPHSPTFHPLPTHPRTLHIHKAHTSAQREPDRRNPSRRKKAGGISQKQNARLLD